MTVNVEILDQPDIHVEPSTDTGVDLILLEDTPVTVLPTAEVPAVVEVDGGVAGPPGPAGPQGIQGIPGPAGGGVALDSTISVATAATGSRTFNHNLTFAPAGIQFFDTAGRPVYVRVTAITSTQITFESDIAFSGTIKLS